MASNQKVFARLHPRPHAAVMATIGVDGPSECQALLLAIEAGLRAGLRSPRLLRWRRELMNMRYRAIRDGWAGWE